MGATIQGRSNTLLGAIVENVHACLKWLLFGKLYLIHVEPVSHNFVPV